MSESLQRKFAFLLSLILLVSGSGVAWGQEEEIFLARKLYSDGMYRLALVQLDKYLSGLGGGAPAPEALFLKGSSHYALSEWEASIEAFTLLGKHYPQYPGLCQVSMKRARALFRLNRIEEARRGFAGVWEQFRDCEEAKHARLMEAQCLFSQGKSSRARELLDDLQLRVTDPGLLAHVLYVKARILEAEGAVDGALTLYASAADASPGSEPSSRALLRRADLLRARGDLEGAASSHSRVIETSDDPEVLQAAIFAKAQVLLELSQFDQAADMFGVFLQHYPEAGEGGEARLLQARALYYAGRYHEASAVLGVLDTTAVREPYYDQVLFLSAHVEKALGRDDRAETLFRQAFVYTVADSVAYRCVEELSSRSLNRSDLTGAEETYLSGLTKVSESAHRAKLWGALGDVYSRGSDFAQAVRAYRHAAEGSTERAVKESYLRKLLDTAITAGDWEEAFVACDDYIALSRDPALTREIGRKREYVRDFLQIDKDAALAMYGDITNRRRPESEAKKLLGDLHARHLKEYEKALGYYGEALHFQEADSAQLAFKIGSVHLTLGQVYAPGSPEGRASHLQESVKWFGIAARAERSTYAEDSYIGGIRAEQVLRGEPAVDHLAKSRYEEYLKRFPSGEHAAEAHVELGDFYAGLALSPSDTAWERALAHYKMAEERTSERELRAKAEYRAACASLATRDTAHALSYLKASLGSALPGEERTKALYQVAELLLSKRELNDAMPHYRELAGTYPYSLEGEKAVARIGDLFFVRASFDSARFYYRLFLDVYRDSPFRDDVYMRMVSAYEKEGERKAAKETIEEFLAQFPGSPLRTEAYVKLGNMLESDARFREAVVAYNAALGTVPPERQAPFHAAIARASFAAGDYEQASAYFQKLMSGASGSEKAELWERRIVCLFRLEKVKEARAEVKRFRKEHGKRQDLLAEISLEEAQSLLRAGQLEQARKIAQSLLSSNLPGSLAPHAHVVAGMTWYRGKDFVKAGEHFEAALAFDLGDSAGLIHSKLASCRYMLEDFDGAIDHYRKALEASTDSAFCATTLFNLGISYSGKENWEEAARCYRELLLNYPDSEESPEAIGNLGYCYQQRGQFVEAMEIYERARQLSDSEGAARAQFWTAECRFNLGQLEEAALDFLKVSYLYPEQHLWAVTGQHRAAQVYEQMGRITEATNIYRVIVEKEGSESQYGKPAYERLKQLETVPQ